VKMEKKILNILVFHICFFLSISLISQTEFICRRVKQEGRVARLRSIFEWLRYRQAHPEQDVWALQRALDFGNIMAWVKDGMEMKRIISEIGDYGSAEEKNETVIFLLQMSTWERTGISLPKIASGCPSLPPVTVSVVNILYIPPPVVPC